MTKATPRPQEEIDDLCRELDAADSIGKSHTVAIKAIRKWQRHVNAWDDPVALRARAAELEGHDA